MDAWLPPEKESVSRARRSARDLCAALDPTARRNVELIVSELAANAVVHARTPFHLGIDGDGASIRVEVADGSNESPVPREWPHRGDPPGGLGLRVVEHLASDWGSTSEPLGGKTVWARVDL